MNKEEVIKERLKQEEERIRKELEQQDKNSEMEKLFLSEIEKFKEEMQEAQLEVSDAIKKTVEISEKYGIPFSGIADIYQNYTPSRLNAEAKWQLKYTQLNKLLRSGKHYCYFDDYIDGWEASAIC